MNEKLMICVHQGFSYECCKFFVPSEGYNLAISVNDPDFNKKISEVIDKYGITTVHLVGMPMLNEILTDFLFSKYPDITFEYKTTEE